MIDLKNLNGGDKLIKEILGQNKQNRQPWSKEKQKQFINQQKNIKPHRSTSK